MHKRKLTRAGKLVFTGISLFLGCTVIRFGTLSAHIVERAVYEETPVRMKDDVAQIKTMAVRKQAATAIQRKNTR